MRARAERFDVSRDPRLVLDPAALAEVSALLRAVPDPSADLEAAYLAGMAHWQRYLVLDPGEDRQDLDAALRLLGPVHRAHPGMVADQFRGLAFGRLRNALAAGPGDELDLAIELVRQVLSTTPGDHPDRAGILNVLCVGLQVRSERAGALADLDEAIAVGWEAVGAFQDGQSARRAMALSNLSVALRMRFERTGVAADLDGAIAVAREAVVVETASARLQVDSARNWGRAAAAGGRWREAVEGFETAIELLARGHRAAWSGMTWSIVLRASLAWPLTRRPAVCRPVWSIGRSNSWSRAAESCSARRWTFAPT